MSDDSTPFVSVVIPTLQEGKYLGRCLDSLSRHSYTNSEIIVVDGGSTDDTIAIASAFGAKIVQASGSTIVIARQMGVEAAGGELIVYATCTYSDR